MSVATGSVPTITPRTEPALNDTITLTGFVATAPRHLVTSGGLPITSFRMATNARRFDKAKNSWVDGETNWYTVNTYRQLAVNAAGAISKGDPVVVLGRLRIRDWENDKRQGTNIEVEADSLGHDLLFGTTSFTRSISSSLSSGSVASMAGEGQGRAPDEAASPATDGNGWAIPGGDSGPAPVPEGADHADSVPF